MPVERMKMRPWLEKMIESRSISGLVWSDKAKTMFTIPWKHAARQGWELDKDARLFKQWAIHTGKYVEGQTTDPKTWKANFRCAMNSLPDIKEVKDRSVHKGNHAVRVFKMLPATHKDKRSKVKERKSRKKSSVKVEEEAEEEEEEEEEEKSDTHSAADTSMSSTQEDTIDSTVPMGLNDLTSILSDDVPEWSLSVEVGGMDFPFQHRFEVSPDHNSDHIFTEEMIEICHQLEKDSNWTAVGSGGKDFLSSEACSSPGSQTSYSSSEPDEMPQYINLDSEFTCSTNEFWSSFAKPFPSL